MREQALDRATARGDLIAGVTTAVMLVPQGMAYAMLAGLPPVVGLYSGVAFLVVLTGSEAWSDSEGGRIIFYLTV